MPLREVNEMPRCASCGILMPTAEIEKQHRGHTILVCSEKCFRTYRTYVYPKYGASPPRPGESG
ncbi:MAG TPA: hypothetical protein QGH28_00775 [Chloroflexota bacterium]|nr:hypothetical protein [Chloroflexota bacterium]